jgi:hypothetical protein
VGCTSATATRLPINDVLLIGRAGFVRGIVPTSRNVGRIDVVVVFFSADNIAPDEDVDGGLDPTPGIREQPRPILDIVLFFD